MSKGAGGVFQKLHVGKVRLLLFSCLLILISVLIIIYSFKSEKPETREIAKRIVSQCEKDSSNRCLKSFFEEFAKEHEFEETKTVLGAIQQIKPSTEYCHPFAHAISIAEVEKDSENWLNVFSYVPESECSYGFFHGVIEGKYRSDRNFMIDDQLISSVCARELNKVGFARSCTHAFGHVLLVQEDGVVTHALNTCDKLSTNLANPCFQGVFMENIQKNNLTEGEVQSELWDENFFISQIQLCNEYSGSKQNECWRSLGPVIRAVKSEFDMAAACQSAKEYLSKRACIREVFGGELLQRLLNGDIESMDYCQFVNGNQEYRECIRDLIDYVLLTSSSLRGGLSDYCKNMKDGEVNYCNEQVNTFFKDLGWRLEEVRATEE